MHRFRLPKSTDIRHSQDYHSEDGRVSAKGHGWSIRNYIKKKSPKQRKYLVPTPSENVNDRRYRLKRLKRIIDGTEIGTYEPKFKVFSIHERGEIHSTESWGEGVYQSLQVQNKTDSGALFWHSHGKARVDSSYAFEAVINKEHHILKLYFHPEYKNLLRRLIPWTGVECSIDDKESFDSIDDGNASKLYGAVKKLYLSDLANSLEERYVHAYNAVKLLYNFLRDKDLYDEFGFNSLVLNGQLSGAHASDISAWAIERDLETVNTAFHRVENDINARKATKGDSSTYGETERYPGGLKALSRTTRQAFMPPLPPLGPAYTLALWATESQNYFKESRHKIVTESSQADIGLAITTDTPQYFTESCQILSTPSKSFALSLPSEFAFSHISPPPNRPLPMIPITENSEEHVNSLWPKHTEKANFEDTFLDAVDSLSKDDIFLNPEFKSKDNIEVAPNLMDSISGGTEAEISRDEISDRNDCLPREGVISESYSDMGAASANGPPLSNLDLGVHSQFSSLYENFMQMETHLEDSLKNKYHLVKKGLPSRSAAWDIGMANIRRMIRKQPPNSFRDVICVNMVESAIIGALEADITHGDQAILHKEIFLKNLDIWRNVLLIPDDQTLYNRTICKLWSRLDIVVDDSGSQSSTSLDMGGLFRMVTAFATSSHARENSMPPPQGGRLKDFLANLIRDAPQVLQGKSAGTGVSLPRGKDQPLEYQDAVDHFLQFLPTQIFSMEHRAKMGDQDWGGIRETTSRSPQRQGESERTPQCGPSDSSCSWSRKDDPKRTQDGFVAITASLINILVFFFLARYNPPLEKCQKPNKLENLDRNSLTLTHILEPLSGFATSLNWFSDLLQGFTNKVQSKSYQNVFDLLNDIICSISIFCDAGSLLLIVIGFLHRGLEKYFSAVTQLMRKTQEIQIYQYFGFEAASMESLRSEMYKSENITASSISPSRESPNGIEKSVSDPSDFRSYDTSASFFDIGEEEIDGSVVSELVTGYRPVSENLQETQNLIPYGKIPIPPGPSNRLKRRKSDSESNSIKKPRITTEGEFKCPECLNAGVQKYFSNIYNMRRHQRERHSGNPPKSQCHSCGEKFSRNYAAKHKCRT